MSYEIGYEPFSNPEQVWVAAGWFVIVQSKESKVVKAVACHRATGKILSIYIDQEMQTNWSYQVAHKIMEVTG